MKNLPVSILDALCGEHAIYILRGWPGLGRVMQGFSLSNIVKSHYPNQKQQFYSSDNGYKFLNEHANDVKEISTRKPIASILGTLGNEHIYSLVENIINEPPSIIVIDGELKLIPVIRGVFKGKIVALTNKYDLFNPHHPVGLRNIFLSYYSYCDHIVIGALETLNHNNTLPINFPDVTWSTPFIRTDICKKSKFEVDSKNNKDNVAVVFGGGDHGAESLKSTNRMLFENIINIALKDTKITFSLFGLNYKEYNVNVPSNVRFGKTGDCSKAIQKAKLIIARAGRNTISEILTLDKPAILISSNTGNKPTDYFRSIEQITNIKAATEISSNIHVWNDSCDTDLHNLIIQLSNTVLTNNNWSPGNVAFTRLLNEKKPMLTIEENDQQVVNGIYKDKIRLGIMREFHDNVTKNEDTAFKNTYDRLKARKSSHIIDVGCGIGSFWSDFEEFEFIERVTLCDQSSELVEHAAKVIKSKGIKDIEKKVIHLDSSVDIDSSNADVILVHQVYHHLKNVENTHSALLKLLDPDGEMIVTTCNQNHMYEIYEQVAKYFAVDYHIARGLSHFNESHLKGLEGFSTLKDIEGSIRCYSVDLLCRYIRSLAIVDRFLIANNVSEIGFMEHIKLWAETIIKDAGYIEVKKSVAYATFTLNHA